MVIGGNRCKLGVSNPLYLMGGGIMSLPEKEDPFGLDNVSFYFNVLD